MQEIRPLPCPFCDWHKIRVIEDEITDEEHVFYKSKFTYCYCKPCGTRGPWAYNVDDDEEVVYRRCVERWNERNGVKHEYSNEKTMDKEQAQET